MGKYWKINYLLLFFKLDTTRHILTTKCNTILAPIIVPTSQQETKSKQTEKIRTPQ